MRHRLNPDPPPCDLTEASWAQSYVPWRVYCHHVNSASVWQTARIKWICFPLWPLLLHVSVSWCGCIWIFLVYTIQVTFQESNVSHIHNKLYNMKSGSQWIMVGSLKSTPREDAPEVCRKSTWESLWTGYIVCLDSRRESAGQSGHLDVITAWPDSSDKKKLSLNRE